MREPRERGGMREGQQQECLKNYTKVILLKLLRNVSYQARDLAARPSSQEDYAPPVPSASLSAPPFLSGHRLSPPCRPQHGSDAQPSQWNRTPGTPLCAAPMVASASGLSQVLICADLVAPSLKHLQKTVVSEKQAQEPAAARPVYCVVRRKERRRHLPAFGQKLPTSLK